MGVIVATSCRGSIMWRINNAKFTIFGDLTVT
jgi:hypothetical protein